jgi:hypothetical protein
MESLQSKAENLEWDVSLAWEELSEMESLRRKWELRNAELFTKNIDLDLEKKDLEDTLIKKKDELAQMIDNLTIAQKVMIEKDTLLQEAVLNNTHLAKQIPKTSSKSEVIGGVSELKKDNGITSSETTLKLPNSDFFQHAIIFVIVLLIIYIL